MPLHVLQICHSYYPPFLDCARQYAALFKETNYEVTTVYLQGEYSQAVVDGSASDDVIFLGYKSRDIGGLKLGAIRKISAIAKSKPFEFCIAHRVKSTYVALLATQLPVVSVHHNYNDYSRWSRRLLVNWYQARIVMLGVSNAVRDDLRRDLCKWPSERIQTLHNHIDVQAVQTQMLARDTARQALNLPLDTSIFGNVGRLHHDKDQATLIKAFAKALPQLSGQNILVIIGTGLLEQALKHLAKTLAIENSVLFLGNVPNAKQYFNAFDVFVLTSDSEPFGMVLLEALAAELPIICSDCGGGAEVVKDVGALFPLADVDVLANTMISVLTRKSQNNTLLLTKKLNMYFSDEAAKSSFWALLLVSQLLINQAYSKLD